VKKKLSIESQLFVANTTLYVMFIFIAIKCIIALYVFEMYASVLQSFLMRLFILIILISTVYVLLKRFDKWRDFYA
jgi:hypothetical protein